MLLKCLALAVAVFSLQAQQPASPDPSKRVYEVLNSTADEAKKWDDKAIAARTQAQIADLIWDNDPENATTYLKAAWAATSIVDEPKRERSAFVNPSLRNAVRREVLLVARKRAPELAETWLAEIVEESKSSEKGDRGTFDDRTARSAVLLQMAHELVAENPKAASELLIDSLRDGISFNFQSVLLRIQQKDPALAEAVFRAAVARLKTAGMIDPNELLTLYSYLYTPGRVFGANTSDNRNQTQLALGGPRVTVPPGRQNPAMAREFLEVASDVLLAAPSPDGPYALITARRLVSAIGSLFREVREQLPEKAALLQARAQQLDSEARFSNAPIPRKPDIPEYRAGESKESFAERRVDLLEESAAKGRDVLTRDIGYAKAAVATTVERYERGLDLAGKVEDKFLRDGVRNWLLYRVVLHFIDAGNLDEARRLNLKNDDAVARAVCLVAGAQKLLKDKDTDRASEWLREAGTLVRKSDASENMARIALGIVSTYGSFDKQASLDWLLYAVKLMRKTPPASLNDDKAPELNGIGGITPAGEVTGSTSGFSLQSAIVVFPRNQFEQVLYVLNDMTPREARGIAVLTLCRNFLRPQPRT
ncbi:MAG TPA: hypothetical protein VFZ22_13540 [Pyrinomonadaceae bacterium]|nr:hypothetical protein [Pyrinomonadaceae bacterium]